MLCSGRLELGGPFEATSGSLNLRKTQYRCQQSLEPLCLPVTLPRLVLMGSTLRSAGHFFASLGIFLRLGFWGLGFDKGLGRSVYKGL